MDSAAPENLKNKVCNKIPAAINLKIHEKITFALLFIIIESWFFLAYDGNNKKTLQKLILFLKPERHN